PPAKRSPMMPDPTTAASRKAVPRASATARRATALLSGRLHGADKGAHELPLDLRRDRVNVDAFAAQELSGVFNVVDARRLYLDRLKARFCKLADVFAFLKRASNATDPQQHAFPNFGRHFSARHNVGGGETASWLQDAECFQQHAALVG